MNKTDRLLAELSAVRGLLVELVKNTRPVARDRVDEAIRLLTLDSMAGVSLNVSRYAEAVGMTRAGLYANKRFREKLELAGRPKREPRKGFVVNGGDRKAPRSVEAEARS